MVKRLPMVDVFAFVDYSKYLHALYQQGRQRGSLSYRAFARRAQLGSPN